MLHREDPKQRQVDCKREQNGICGPESMDLGTQKLPRNPTA